MASKFLSRSQPFFIARLPVPLITQYQAIDGTQAVVAPQDMQQFKADALELLDQAQIHDGLVIRALRQNQSRRCPPLGIRLRFCFMSESQYQRRRLLNELRQTILETTFGYLGLRINQITEVHTYQKVDAKNPHVEIELYFPLLFNNAYIND